MLDYLAELVETREVGGVHVCFIPLCLSHDGCQPTAVPR